jgi:hypothetical protein
MVINSTACMCICSVGTYTCWSWTVPFLWTDCYTCSLSRTLSCSLLTMATYSMEYTSLPFSSHHCCELFAYHRIYWGAECLCAVISRYAPKLVMFRKQFKPEMFNSQSGRMESYMNNMQWSPKYCPLHYYTNWNAMWQDTEQTELICSLSSWWMVSGSICPSKWHDSITQLQDADITSYCLNLMKNLGY